VVVIDSDIDISSMSGVSSFCISVFLSMSDVVCILLCVVSMLRVISSVWLLSVVVFSFKVLVMLFSLIASVFIGSTSISCIPLSASIDAVRVAFGVTVKLPWMLLVSPVVSVHFQVPSASRGSVRKVPLSLVCKEGATVKLLPV